jgi:hypothetical protein
MLPVPTAAQCPPADAVTTTAYTLLTLLLVLIVISTPPHSAIILCVRVIIRVFVLRCSRCCRGSIDRYSLATATAAAVIESCECRRVFCDSSSPLHISCSSSGRGRSRSGISGRSCCVMRRRGCISGSTATRGRGSGLQKGTQRKAVSIRG